jgi:hypothetical protein
MLPVLCLYHVVSQASACIALMGALVTSNSTLGGRSDPRQASSSAMSLEVVRAMREAGAVKALAQALKLINTEHAKVCCKRLGVGSTQQQQHQPP